MRKFLEVYKHHLVCDACSGLCNIMLPDGKRMGETEQFLLITDFTSKEWNEHLREGYGAGWWGRLRDKERFSEFTPLRQNIILLCAALNNEL
jgi:hypothetical protein